MTASLISKRIDLITKSVIKAEQNVISHSQDASSRRPKPVMDVRMEEISKSIGKIASCMGVFKLLIWITISLIIIIAVILGLKQRFGANREKKDSDYNADRFKYEEYLGKDELISSTINDAAKICAWCCEQDNEILSKVISPANMAYLLYGPPGTGKTQFVRKVTYMLDMILREMAIYHQKSHAEVAKLKEDPVKFQEYLDKMESRVSYVYSTPSSLLGQFVGQTEKAISSLFDNARKLASKPYTASIIMFDEAEAFFKKRGSGQQSWEGSMSSEFLSQLSATPSVYRPVFVFAATNHSEVMDRAFMRRFGRKISFDYPDAAERRILIKSKMSDLLSANIVSERDIEEYVLLSDKSSHAFIVRTIQKYKRYSRNCEIETFHKDTFLKELTSGSAEKE